jgi:hypothetical protein
MHTATILQAGDEMYVGYMHPSGKYVEVKLMGGADVLQVESRDEAIHVIGGHKCRNRDAT